MTFEEIQAAIAGMLAVQKELQTSQVNSKQEIIEITQSIRELREQGKEQDLKINKLIENGERHDRRINLLINNSFDREQDYMSILERIIRLERRILEQKKD